MALRSFINTIRTPLSSSLSRSLSSSSFSSFSSFHPSFSSPSPSPSLSFSFFSRSLSSLAPGQNYKQTTNITGVDVVENPREVLTALYGEIIKRLLSYPSTSLANDYNKECHKLIAWRLKKVGEITDIERLERVIGGGIVEELIREAEQELDLIIRMNETDYLSAAFNETKKEIELNPNWKEEAPFFINPEQEIVFHSIDEYNQYHEQQEKEFWVDIDKEIQQEDAAAAAAAASASASASAPTAEKK